MRHVLNLAITLMCLCAPAAAQTFPLSGGQEVPRVDTAASGRCAAELGPGQSTLHLSCTTDVDDVTSIDVHRGVRGETGPSVFSLTVPQTGVARGSFSLSDRDLAYLLTEGLYVEVSSAAHPDGEIRGQIVGLMDDLSAQVLRFPLETSQVVPPAGTDAKGACVATIDDEDLHLVCRQDVEHPTAAHIHSGATGTNGGVIVNLGLFVDLGSLDDGTIFATIPRDSLGDEIFDGSLYVQVHSEEFPGGELRGQMVGCFSDRDVLCLNDNRFSLEVDWRTSDARTGRGGAVRENATSGLFWFFNPDNAEMLLKVIDGCSVNNRYWVFLSATTDVRYDLDVTDTATGQTRRYSNPLGHPATPVLDTNAFATCP
jgi:hypothetical protein